jgi:hypothetical protein
MTEMNVQVEEQPWSKKRKKIVEISFEDESIKRYLISPTKIEEKNKICRRQFETKETKKVNKANTVRPEYNDHP